MKLDRLLQFTKMLDVSEEVVMKRTDFGGERYELMELKRKLVQMGPWSRWSQSCSKILGEEVGRERKTQGKPWVKEKDD